MRTSPLLLLGLSCPLGVLALSSCNGDKAQSVCGPDRVFRNGTCQSEIGVAVNGEGYLTTRRKRAVFQGESADYSLNDAASGAVVYRGKATKMRSDDAQWDVFRADFSDFVQQGTYVLQMSGKSSEDFAIEDDVLEPSLTAAMLGLYGLRCGEAVQLQFRGADYAHGACHLAPASLERVGTGVRDDTGGWHDAGDYGKYVTNGAFSVGVLLKAWEDFPDYLDERDFEIPEAGDAVPDILDESRVELQWLLKTQFEDGSFAHKVTGAGFEGDIMPEGDGQKRLFFSASTTATGDAVAALAQAARIYEPYDGEFAASCLAAARQGQDFLDLHPENIASEQIEGGTGMYGPDGNDSDERLWALAELWETTGESPYLDALETLIPNVDLRPNFDWADVGNLGLVTYALSSREGRDSTLVATLVRDIVEMGDTLAAGAEGDAYGRGMNMYYWGTNGVMVRSAYLLHAAHRLYPNTAYLDAITAQLDHMLGINPFGRSYVTRLGVNPVGRPHHRPSMADSTPEPWPGLLIGGPHGQGDLADPMLPQGLNWVDQASNYWHNEVAINWNTAFVYALVAALSTKDDQDADCVPNCLPAVGAGGAGMGGSGSN